MAALDRALALAEREDGSVLVGEELDLDVARPLDEALAVDAVVAERGLRLAAGRLDRVLELGRIADDPHPAATSSGSRLDHEREADLVRLAGGQGRNSGFGRDPLRLELVAALTERLGRRPDEEQPGRLDGLREVRVLGQEAVPGMDRVGARRLRRPDVLLGVAGSSGSRPSRPRGACGRRRGRRARRRRPSRSRPRGTPGRCARRSRRGWLRGASGSP